jgi:hypothetical protein
MFIAIKDIVKKLALLINSLECIPHVNTWLLTNERCDQSSIMRVSILLVLMFVLFSMVKSDMNQRFSCAAIHKPVDVRFFSSLTNARCICANELQREHFISNRLTSFIINCTIVFIKNEEMNHSNRTEWENVWVYMSSRLI